MCSLAMTVVRSLPEFSLGNVLGLFDDFPDSVAGLVIGNRLNFRDGYAVFVFPHPPPDDMAGHQGAGEIGRAAARRLDDGLADGIEDFPTIVFESDLFLRGVIPGGGGDIAVQLKVGIFTHRT